MAEITQLPQRDDDPYLAARQEYSDRYANLAAGKRNWQFAALGFFLVAVMSLAVSIIQVRQVKRIPYVVEADARTGYVITMPQPLTAQLDHGQHRTQSSKRPSPSSSRTLAAR